MLEPMHSLVTNCSVVEACVQVRAEGPMEHGAQGKRSDTLGITCWSSRALKGKSITMCFRLLPDSSLCQNGKQVEIITKMIFELCYIEAIIYNQSRRHVITLL